jgi:hypothetical protein
MENETAAGFMRVLVNVLDARRVEARTPAHDTVDGIAFGEKEFTQIRTVLAGDSSDES